MKLTIEKAKEIVNHPENYCDIGPLGHAQIWKSKGFIEGWNQAIETIEMGIVESQTLLSVGRESVLIFVSNLKVEGEK